MRQLLSKYISRYGTVSPLGVTVEHNGTMILLSQEDVEGLVDLALKGRLLDPQWLEEHAEEAIAEDCPEGC